MTKTLEVLTYNIHKGFGPGKLRFMLPAMREAIQAVNTQIVFLQEVQGEHKRQQRRIHNWPVSSQFEFLAEQFWPHYAYGKNAIYQAGHHGNAILSKYPFITWENINVATHARASRSLLHGLIQVPHSQQVVHVLCVHFGLFKNERSNQLTRLVKRIAERIPNTDPLIIAGDFNDWRKVASVELEQELGLREVFKEQHGDYAKTFPAWRPAFSTDRIYYRGLKLEEGKRLIIKPWRSLSDHLPLYAKFILDE